MAIVKVKPTSPGRRAMVKVVNKELHKGKPFAALLDTQSRPPAVTTTVISPRVTRVVVTSITIVSSTSVARKTVFRQRSSVWSTTRTVARTSRWFCTQTASAATSSLRRVSLSVSN